MVAKAVTLRATTERMFVVEEVMKQRWATGDESSNDRGRGQMDKEAGMGKRGVVDIKGRAGG